MGESECLKGECICRKGFTQQGPFACRSASTIIIVIDYDGSGDGVLTKVVVKGGDDDGDEEHDDEHVEYHCDNQQASTSPPLLICSLRQLWKVRRTRRHLLLPLLQGHLPLVPILLGQIIILILFGQIVSHINVAGSYGEVLRAEPSPPSPC